MSCFHTKKRSFLKTVTAGLFALTLASCTNTAGFGGLNRGVNASDPVKVALLVPLESGKSELDFLASSLVNAARLARGDLQGVELDLAVYSTAGEPARAAAVAQQAMNEGAQIVLGPLFSTATSSVAPIAAQKGVAVMSFSNNRAIAGNNVYTLGLGFEAAADRVVSYSIGRGQSSIAVVHSDDVAGQQGLSASVDAIQRFGGTFAGASSYSITAQGISEAAPQISQQLRSSGANAVVLTDDAGAGLTFLTPMLASFDLANSDVQFLGLTRWNEPAEAAETPSMQGGIFAAPDPGLAAQFTSRYTATYGTDPHPLAGLAYDGVAAVGAMMRSAQTSGAGQALTPSQITNPAGFSGVNGIFRFRPDGGTDRGLAIMQLRSGQAVVVDPAPRSFTMPGS